MPVLPKEVTAPLTDAVQARLQPVAIAHARRVWREWWRSRPSHAVDLQSDMEALSWWIICVFRRALYLQIVIQQPMVIGSQRQPVPNPLERVIARMTEDINRAESRFGMTTLDRFRMHFEQAGEEAGPRSWLSEAANGGDAGDDGFDPYAVLAG